jgi:integral membrane sensor domain MASE1
LRENIITLVVGLFSCYLAIRWLRFPFVSIGLLLLIASFRLGGFGTSVLSLSFGLLMTNLWLVGIRPLGLDAAASANPSLEGLPVIALLASLMPRFPWVSGATHDAPAPGRCAPVSAVFANRWNIPQSAC